ncbi:MAG TPA: hypothetical protein VJ879_12855, partial [Desulfobacter sp.]|nr:hypothetical protein [Desulfobacter sp.]
ILLCGLYYDLNIGHNIGYGKGLYFIVNGELRGRALNPKAPDKKLNFPEPGTFERPRSKCQWPK